MNLSRDEDTFLRHWMHDEVNYQNGRGPAKQLQLQNQASPADLAVLISAAYPDPAAQKEASIISPTPGPVAWPWSSKELLRARVAEAKAALLQMRVDRLLK